MYGLRWVLAGALTALLAVIVLPDLLFGLDQHRPFVELIAFRPWALAATAVLAVLLAAVAAGRRRAWPVAAGALAVTVIGAVMVVPRAVPWSGPATGRPMTIMVANVYEGRADPDELAVLIRDGHPDVVSLPEAGDRFRDRIEPLVASLGYHAYVSAPGASDIASVMALVSDRLGAVQVRIGKETELAPYLEITAGTLGAMRVVAFHAAAPVSDRIGAWRHDMALLARWCLGSAPGIVAGDFNATLDHSAFRAGTSGCGDAAADRGDGLIPTWGPYGRPELRTFGPQIDHVLMSEGIGAAAFAVYDLPGSDHRAVVATVEVP